MADLGGFDASQVDPAGDFSPLPAGRYEVSIIESEWVENASSAGKHLKLTLVVASGEHEGRNLWHRLNLDNPSEKAVQISRGQLSSICRAVNVLTPRDSADLHNLPLVAKVIEEKYEGGISNKITAFYPRENGEAAKPPAAAPAAPSAGSGKKAPWTKGK